LQERTPNHALLAGTYISCVFTATSAAAGPQIAEYPRSLLRMDHSCRSRPRAAGSDGHAQTV